jgi:hypothetical protein
MSREGGDCVLLRNVIPASLVHEVEDMNTVVTELTLPLRHSVSSIYIRLELVVTTEETCSHRCTFHVSTQRAPLPHRVIIRLLTIVYKDRS